LLRLTTHSACVRRKEVGDRAACAEEEEWGGGIAAAEALIAATGATDADAGGGRTWRTL
jgi:hypothetical protein